MAEPRTLKAGLCFCALAQPQFCLRLLTLGGRWGCAGPGRSTGPPLLHWLIERRMVVSGLGYTPGPPMTDVTRFRTPLVPSGGVRLSLTRAAAFDPHLGRYVVAYSPNIIEPCLPSPAEHPPAGPEWVHEIKHDGYRLMARRDPIGIRLITRNGHDWSPRYPLIVEGGEPAQGSLMPD
jgi:hypothetical protein